jgi:hypothetical protein
VKTLDTCGDQLQYRSCPDCKFAIVLVAASEFYFQNGQTLQLGVQVIISDQLQLNNTSIATQQALQLQLLKALRFATQKTL